MILHILALALLMLVQPPVTPTPATPPATPAPAAPAPATPAPAAPAPPPATPAPATPTPPKEPTALEKLEPSSRRLVEQQAANFVVTQDGKYWDRQVWLKRQELREKMRRVASKNAPASDLECAYGATATAPLDPNEDDPVADKGVSTPTRTFRIVNLPLWRAADGAVLSDVSQIGRARNAPKAPDTKPGAPATPPPPAPLVDSPATHHDFMRTAMREAVTPEELAHAILDKRAELSQFKWTKRVISKATPESVRGTVVTAAVPESVEFLWRREALPVRWIKDSPKPTKPADATPPAAPGTNPPAPSTGH